MTQIKHSYLDVGIAKSLLSYSDVEVKWASTLLEYVYKKAQHRLL